MTDPLRLQCELGECPLWDEGRGCLWLVDIVRCRLIRHDWSAGREPAEWPLPALGGGLALCEDGRLLVAVQTGLFLFDPEEGAWAFHRAVEDAPVQRLNEGKADARGRFWIGSINTTGRVPTGGLFRVDAAGPVRVLDGIAVPNCLVFAGDHAFFSDSARKVVWRFAFDADAGTLGDRRVHLDLTADPGIPDGGCLDAEGHLWVAQFGGAMVRRFDPDGREVRRLVLPVSQVTSLAFCGPRLDRLAITTAKRLLTDADRRRQPEAGDLFWAEPGIRGVPEPRAHL